MLLILGAAHRASEGERMVRAKSWPGWEPMQLLGTRRLTIGLGGETTIGGLAGMLDDTQFERLQSEGLVTIEQQICRTELGVDHVVSADSSCLMQMGGYLSRHGIAVTPLHIADLLALSLGLA